MVEPVSLGVRLPYAHMGLLTHTKYGSLMTYVLSAFWVACSGRNKDSGMDNDKVSQIHRPHRNVQEVRQTDSRGGWCHLLDVLRRAQGFYCYTSFTQFCTRAKRRKADMRPEALACGCTFLCIAQCGLASRLWTSS